MEKSIPLINVSQQNQELKAQIEASLAKVIDSGAFIMGPEVLAFESEFKAYTGVDHAIACASGTDALLLPLMAMDLKPGDEVLVPSFTFYATVASIVRVGATPVFVDSDETYNMSLQDLEKKITKRTRAVIPVYLFGQILEMNTLQSLLQRQKQKIFLLEDAAQSMGAKVGDKQAGAWGDFGAYSFYPTKNLGAMGDAGMVSARTPEMAERVSMIRVHGSKQRYYHELIGFNSRLDSFQAAILRIKLKNLRRYEEERGRVAAHYTKLLRQTKLIDSGAIRLPVTHPGQYHVWNQYTVRAQKRDDLRKYMSERKIGSEIYYPLPMHLQKCFAFTGSKKGDLPLCEKMAEEVVSLPMFPELSNQDVERVVATISAFYA